MEQTKQLKWVPLGRVVITPGALATLMPDAAATGLKRHAAADWGDVGKEDQRLNDEALRDGERLLSAYSDCKGTKFWVITEADRSMTTVLLPAEY